MILKCIETVESFDIKTTLIIKDKFYKVLGIYNDSYMVTTEPGHKHWFLKYRFEKIEEARDNKINEILYSI
jgi:hypothetical protein